MSEEQEGSAQETLKGLKSELETLNTQLEKLDRKSAIKALLSGAAVFPGKVLSRALRPSSTIEDEVAELSREVFDTWKRADGMAVNESALLSELQEHVTAFTQDFDAFSKEREVAQEQLQQLAEIILMLDQRIDGQDGLSPTSIDLQNVRVKATYAMRAAAKRYEELDTKVTRLDSLADKVQVMLKFLGSLMEANKELAQLGLKPTGIGNIR